MRRALFICTQNRLRSPTAEQVFSAWPNVEAESAGLGNDANVPVTPELLGWADTIFVMEKAHKSKLSKKFGSRLYGKRIICLDIPDEYDFMQPELIKLFESKAGKFFALRSNELSHGRCQQEHCYIRLQSCRSVLPATLTSTP